MSDKKKFGSAFPYGGPDAVVPVIFSLGMSFRYQFDNKFKKFKFNTYLWNLFAEVIGG